MRNERRRCITATLLDPHIVQYIIHTTWPKGIVCGEAPLWWRFHICEWGGGNRSNNIFVIYVKCVVKASRVYTLFIPLSEYNLGAHIAHVFICHAAVSANIKLPLVRRKHAESEDKPTNVSIVYDRNISHLPYWVRFVSWCVCVCMCVDPTHKTPPMKRAHIYRVTDFAGPSKTQTLISFLLSVEVRRCVFALTRALCVTSFSRQLVCIYKPSWLSQLNEHATKYTHFRMASANSDTAEANILQNIHIWIYINVCSALSLHYMGEQIDARVTHFHETLSDEQ